VPKTNSVDYLELLFERWLRKQTEKKLVFVIDELDKVIDDKALKLIKEYKNLFSRSLAIFIFITGQDAYSLTEKDRELKAEEGGIFPTLFTHVYYLPIPNRKDLEKYLDNIFSEREDVSNEDYRQLKHYLLFRAKNDFFALKNLINDLAHIEKGKIFFDINIMKNYDRLFTEVAEIYNYASTFCDKHHNRAKKYWKENSTFQKEVFDFLNQYFKKNFEIVIKDESKNIQSLLGFLQRFEILENINTEKFEESPGVSKEKTEFRWTGEYKEMEKADQLFEEEEKFLNTFDELIKIANDLDDLTKHYKDGKFYDYKKIFEGEDGNTLSGVNLHSTYLNLVDLRNKLKDPKKRMGVLIEDVESAMEEIEPQINEVKSRSFQVFTNALQNILSKNNELYTGQNVGQRPIVFNACPNFNTVFSRFDHKLYGKTDGSREVLVVRNFNAFDEIHEGLKSLNDQKNLLVVNFIDDNTEITKNPTIKIESIDKLGRKRAKSLTIKNFINFVFTNDFRDLSGLLHKIEKHLT